MGQPRSVSNGYSAQRSAARPAVDLRRVGATLGRDMGALLFPVACPGCGQHDVVICSVCLSLFAQGMWRSEGGAPKLMQVDQGPRLPVWSLAEYGGAVRQVVLAWKNRHRLDISPLLTALVAVAAAELIESVLAALNAEGINTARVQVQIVPMPSSASNQRRRGGRQPVLELTHGVVAGLEGTGVNAVVADVLVQRRGVRDQVGLSRRQRQQNLLQALTLRRGTVFAHGAMVLLVDDILTTGATLAAAERILAEAGVIPLGALTLVATPGGPEGTFGLTDMPASG